jgi:hypothetical protein
MFQTDVKSLLLLSIHHVVYLYFETTGYLNKTYEVQVMLHVRQQIC